MAPISDKSKISRSHYGNLMDFNYPGTPNRPRKTREEIVEKDILNLARTIMGEAEDQGPVGWEAVGRTIRNRLDAGRGRSFSEVVLDPYQYSIWNDFTNERAKKIAKMEKGQGNEIFDQIHDLAEDIYYDVVPYTHDEVGDIVDSDLYYNPKKVAKTPDWVARSEYLGKIGDHLFYKDTSRTSGKSDAVGRWRNPNKHGHGHRSDPRPGALDRPWNPMSYRSYDYVGAEEAGVGPEVGEDGRVHWGSMDPRPRANERRRIFKSRSHPSFNKTIESEGKRYNEIVQDPDDGYYYSQPHF